jgi:hypothetical protein
VDDVAARLGRPLADTERGQVQALLDDAETIIRARVPDLDDRVDAGRLAPAVVRLVLVAVVLRVVRNPGGYRSETAGDYSYTMDGRAASGALQVMPDEWRLLGVGDGAFTIAPHTRRAWPWAWVDGWPHDPMDGPAWPGPPPCPPSRYRPRRRGGPP